MCDRAGVPLRVPGGSTDPAGAGTRRVRRPAGDGAAAAGQGPDDDQWWIRGYLAREGLPTDPLLPPSLRLAKEIENLPEQVRHLTTEAEVRAAVRELNARIAEHLRAPSGPAVPVRPVNPDRVVAQWRAARQAAGD